MSAFPAERTWFTADLHFGHKNILRLCDRPFADIEAHDQALLAAINDRVGVDDHLFILGDFAMAKRETIVDRFKAIRCRRKYLIVGNHDKKHTLELPWTEPPTPLKEITVDRRKIVLCHYGMRVWNKIHGGAWHFYGHSHGRLPGAANTIDVGVDNFEYAPARIDQIGGRMAELGPAEKLYME